MDSLLKQAFGHLYPEEQQAEPGQNEEQAEAQAGSPTPTPAPAAPAAEPSGQVGHDPYQERIQKLSEKVGGQWRMQHGRDMSEHGPDCCQSPPLLCCAV